MCDEGSTDRLGSKSNFDEGNETYFVENSSCDDACNKITGSGNVLIGGNPDGDGFVGATYSTPGNAGDLPFDPTAIQEIILKLSDAFDLRVLKSKETTAAAVTSSLALAGTYLGKTLGGKVGAAIGEVVCGACGFGVTLVKLREIWEDVWWKLPDLYDLTYDYIGALGFKDYQTAARYLMDDRNKASHLAKMIADAASSKLGKEVISLAEARSWGQD